MKNDWLRRLGPVVEDSTDDDPLIDDPLIISF